ncbi:hypothetical protein ANO11243_012320 [Dothideomycetidae sp. 11243]|nr:hypothetical protein ANO11243_012320 [fungal sp. No.11243]
MVASQYDPSAERQSNPGLPVLHSQPLAGDYGAPRGSWARHRPGDSAWSRNMPSTPKHSMGIAVLLRFEMGAVTHQPQAAAGRGPKARSCDTGERMTRLVRAGISKVSQLNRILLAKQARLDGQAGVARTRLGAMWTGARSYWYIRQQDVRYRTWHTATSVRAGQAKRPAKLSWLLTLSFWPRAGRRVPGVVHHLRPDV